MRAKSAKAKGGRFENYLVERLREIDPKASKTAGSGSGLDKQDIRLPKLDIEVEAKNHAGNINLIKWWEQTKNQSMGQNMSILAIRNPKKPEFKETLIVMDLEDFISIYQK